MLVANKMQQWVLRAREVRGELIKWAESPPNLRDVFTAVSKPIFGREHSFKSSRRDPQEWLKSLNWRDLPPLLHRLGPDECQTTRTWFLFPTNGQDRSPVLENAISRNMKTLIFIFFLKCPSKHFPEFDKLCRFKARIKFQFRLILQSQRPRSDARRLRTLTRGLSTERQIVFHLASHVAWSPYLRFLFLL